MGKHAAPQNPGSPTLQPAGKGKAASLPLVPGGTANLAMPGGNRPSSLAAKTGAILGELADGMVNERSRAACARFIEHLRHDDEAVIIEADPRLLWRGFELYRRRPDKDWSLTDCISFVVMADEGLTEALTGDHHFEQAGFTALLS